MKNLDLLLVRSLSWTAKTNSHRQNETHLWRFSIAQFQHFSLQLGFGLLSQQSRVDVGGVVKARWFQSPLTSCVAACSYCDNNTFFSGHTSHICVSWQPKVAASWETWHTFTLRVSLSNTLGTFSCITTHLIVWPFTASTSLKIKIQRRCSLLFFIPSFFSFRSSRSNKSPCVITLA